MPSFSYPSSRASGYVVQATDWNTDIVGNIQWLGKDRPAVLAVETADQTISNNSVTAVTYNDADAYDTCSQHDTVTNNSRITVGTSNTGLYAIHASGQFAANATGQRYVILRLNGTTELYRVSNDNPSGTNAWAWQIHGYYRLTATTDYIECCVYQNSGGNLALQGATITSRLGAVWMGQ